MAAQQAELTITIRAKEQAQAAIDQVRAQFRQLARDIDTMQKQLDKLGAGKGMQELQANVQKQAAGISAAMKKGMAQAAQEVDRGSTVIVRRFGEATRQWAVQAQAQAFAVTSGFQRLGAAVTAASSNVRNLGPPPELFRLGQGISTVATLTTSLKDRLAVFGKEAVNVFLGIQQGSEAWFNLLRGGGASALSGFTTLLAGMSTSTGVLAAGVGVLATAMGVGVKVAADYDAALRDLSIATGLTGDRLDAARKDALAFSESSTFGFHQVVEAIKDIADSRPELQKNSAALSEVTKQAVLLGQATGADLHTAVTVLITAMNQFGLETKDTAKIVDTLAATTTAAVVPLSELGQQLRFVGTLANATGLKLEETGAILAVLSAQHIPIRRATTAFSEFFGKLQAGPRETNPAIVGLSEALENLAEQHLSVTEIQSRFGQGSAQFVQAIINNRAQIEKYREELTQQGTAARQAEIRSGSLGAALSELGHATVNLSAGMGGLLVQGITPVVQGFTLFVSGVRQGGAAIFDFITKNASHIQELRNQLQNLKAERGFAEVLGDPQVLQRFDQQIADVQQQIDDISKAQDELIVSTEDLTNHQRALSQQSAEVSRVLGQDQVDASNKARDANREMLKAGVQTTEGFKTYIIVQSEVERQQKETGRTTQLLGDAFGFLDEKLSSVTLKALGLDFRKFNDGIREAIENAKKLGHVFSDQTADLDSQLAQFGTRAEQLQGKLDALEKKNRENQQKTAAAAIPALAPFEEQLRAIREKRAELLKVPTQPPLLSPVAGELADLDIAERKATAARDALIAKRDGVTASQDQLTFDQKAVEIYDKQKVTLDEQLALRQAAAGTQLAGLQQAQRDAQIELGNVSTQEQREEVMKRIQGIQENIRNVGREQLQNEINELKTLRDLASAVKVPAVTDPKTGKIVTPEQVINVKSITTQLDQQIKLREQALATDRQTNDAASNQNEILQSRYADAARVRQVDLQAQQVTTDLQKQQINSTIEVLQLGLSEEQSITKRQDIQRQIIGLKRQSLELDIASLQATIDRTKADLEAGRVAGAQVQATQAQVDLDEKRKAILEATLPVFDAQLEQVKDLGKASSEVGRGIEDAFANLAGGFFDGKKTKDQFKQLRDDGVGILKDIFTTTLKNKLDFEGIVSKNLFTDKKGLVGQFSQALGLVKKSADENIGTGLTETVQKATEAVQAVAPAAQDAGQAVSDAGVQAADGWTGFFDTLLSAGKSTFDTLIGWASKLIGLVSGGGGAGGTGGSGILSGLFGLLGFGGGGGTAAAAASASESLPAIGTALGFAPDTAAAFGLGGFDQVNIAMKGLSVASAAAGEGAEQLGSTLGQTVASYAGLVVALAAASKAIIDGRKQMDAATLGTTHAGSNVITGVSAGLIAGFTAGGAAIGSVVPLIGTAIGAAVGAAVGAAASQAISSATSKAITDSLKKGTTQKDLENNIQKGLTTGTYGIILDILGGPANLLNSMLLKGVLAPDLNKIFGKIFRRVIGGPGGFDTRGIAVNATGIPAGLEPQQVEGRTVARLIAGAIGAGGEALQGKRQEILTHLVLATAKKRAAKTGEDIGDVIGQIYVTAFDGSFIRAMRSIYASSANKRRRDADAIFAAKEFAKGTGVGEPFFQTEQGIIKAEGIVPGPKAVNASRKAFAEALKAAFADAADSSAFKKSIGNSIQQAFADAATTALVKGPLGEAFAPFFSVSKENRKKLKRARRRRDVPGQLDILEDEFGMDTANLQAVISQPEFPQIVQRLTDDFLKLQVALAAATGDMTGVSTAINSYLAPAIATVAGYQQLQRDIASRTAFALAGPGFGGRKEQVAQLTRTREEVEREFRAQSGGAGPEDLARVLGYAPAGMSPADIRQMFSGLASVPGSDQGAFKVLGEGDPTQLLARFSKFADARLDELEGELSLLNDIQSALKDAEKAFAGFQETIQRVQYGFDATADAEKKVQKAEAAFAEVDWSNIDPDKLSAFQDALGEAISAVVAHIGALRAAAQQFADNIRQIDEVLGRRNTYKEFVEATEEVNKHAAGALAGNEEDIAVVIQNLGKALEAAGERFTFFKQIVEDFVAFSETISTALLGADASRGQLEKRRADIARLTPKAIKPGEGQEEAASQLRKAFGEAVSLATSRLQFFKGAEEAFTGTGEQAAVLGRGRRASRQQLAKRRAEIASLLPTALAGGEEALAQLQKLLPEALSIGQQALSGGRLRALARYIESISEQLAAKAKAGEDAAKGTLTELQRLNDSVLIPAFENQKTDAENQLLELRALNTQFKIATDAQLVMAYAQLGRLGTLVTDSQGFIQSDLNAIALYIGAVKNEFTEFKASMDPVIAYLSGLAEDTLTKQLAHIEDILGGTAGVRDILRGIAGQYGLSYGDPNAIVTRARGGTVRRGQVALVGERGPELFIAPATGMVVPNRAIVGGGTSVSVSGNEFHFHFPEGAPLSKAEASEFGRTAADAFTRKFLELQRRTGGLRKVA